MCVFCDKIKDEHLEETQPHTRVYSFEPLNPVTPGHRLFISREHFSVPGVNPGLTGLVIGQAVAWADWRYPAYNVIINAGRDASQTVPHMHVHIVPRRPGDGLILPWTNQEK